MRKKQQNKISTDAHVKNVPTKKPLFEARIEENIFQ